MQLEFVTSKSFSLKGNFIHVKCGASETKTAKKKRAQKTSSPCWEKLEIEMSTSTPKHKRKSEHEKLEFWSDRCDVSAPTDLRSETSKRIKQKTRVFKALFFFEEKLNEHEHNERVDEGEAESSALRSARADSVSLINLIGLLRPPSAFVLDHLRRLANERTNDRDYVSTKFHSTLHVAMN